VPKEFGARQNIPAAKFGREFGGKEFGARQKKEFGARQNIRFPGSGR